MEFLLERSTVIALALLGAAVSVIASWCNSRPSVSKSRVKQLTVLSYILMGASMILFILAGLFSDY